MTTSLSVLGRTAVALLAGLLTYYLLASTIEWLQAPVANQQLRPLQKVECSFNVGSGESGTWQICSLPHNWDQQKPGYAGDAWYRFTMERPSQASEPPALWLVASMNANVTVNGVSVGSGGRMDEPVARHWNQYLLFTLPKSLLDQDHNSVVIRVHGYANNSSGLLKLYTGPTSQLKQIHQNLMLRSNLLTYGALIVTLLIGLLAGVAALVGRNLTAGCFALGCLISILYLLDTMVVNIPISREVWERAVHVSIVCSEMFFLLFIFRVLGLDKRWLTVGMLIYGAIGTLVISMASEPSLLPAASVWEGISLVMVIIANLVCFWRWLERQDLMALAAALALLAVVISFTHDWLPWVLGQGVEPPFIFYLGPTGFVMLMASLLIGRLIADLNYELGLSLSLSKKVKQQKVAIEREHESMMQLWEDQVVRDERDRIVRELHDGVGGSLSNALAIVESGSHIHRSLQGAIDELRLVMGTIDEDADVASLLGTLRPRLTAEVKESGGVLDWHIEDIPSKIPDNAATGMHLVRMLQECVHNALRHGDATLISLHLDRSCLLVVDNGSGFDEQAVKLGRGLKNLRWRAENLGAGFDISSSDSGTTISFCWH